MGDAGSLMIGLVFAASSLLLLQKGENSPYLSIVFIGVVAVLFIPVLDALRVFRKRAKMGKSPLAADKTHLHHLIISKGMKHKTVALFITLIMLGLMFMAFLTHQWVGLTLSLVCNLIVFYSLTSFLQLQANLISWKEKIGQMETAYQ